MKFKKISMLLAVALLMMCSFALGAHAAGTAEPITAYMRYDVDVKYNGESVVMKNVNGVRVYPISYEGSTYVPIRAIGNLFGVPVEWDSATKSVVLGTSAKSQGIDFIDNFKPYSFNWDMFGGGTEQVQSADKKTKEVGGVTVNHWLSLQYKYGEGDAYVFYNIGGKYDTLTFDATTTEDTTLYIYGDNEAILAEIPLTANQVPKRITVPLLKTTQLHLQAKLTNSSGVAGGVRQQLHIINAYLT